MTTAYIILIMLNVLIRPADMPVKISPELMVQAQVRAVELCDKQQWSHEGWGNAFKGGGSSYIGENLARNWHDPVKAVNAWILSPSHYHNMVNPRYKIVGVGEDPRCDLIVLLFADKYEKPKKTN